jgi:hypothetical protein
VWLEYRDEKFFNDYLKTTCRDRARREAKVEAPEWKNTYLRYGDDDGGAWLIKDIGLHRTEQFFNQIKGVLKNNPNSTKSGTKWLAAVAFSPLREKLSFEEKSAVSNLNNELARSWRNFNILKNLLAGRAQENIEPAPPEETPYLRTELRSRLQDERELIVSEELEEKLKKLIGEFPDEVNLIIGTRRRAAQRRQEVVAEDAAQAEKPQKRKIEPFKNLHDFIDEERKANESRQLLALNVHYLLASEKHRDALAADFWQSKNFPWKNIYPLLPPGLRAKILHLLLAMNNKEAIEKFHKLYEQAGDKSEQSAFRLALWETVLTSAAGAEIIQKLKKRLGGKHPLEANLREFLRQSETRWELVKKEPDADESEEAGEDESAIDEGAAYESAEVDEDESSAKRENSAFRPEKKGVQGKIDDVWKWFQNK